MISHARPVAAAKVLIVCQDEVQNDLIIIKAVAMSRKSLHPVSSPLNLVQYTLVPPCFLWR
jgi:hypothetical protein